MAITTTLALTGVALSLLIVGFLAISVIMILIVLIQRPQGGGLSGAFGAAADGAGQTALGVKTGDTLTAATIVVFVLFLSFAIVLNFAIRPADPLANAPQLTADTEQTTTQAPEETATDDTTPQPAETNNTDDNNTANDSDGDAQPETP